MNQHEIWTFAEATLHELSRGDDGWPRAWCDAITTAHRTDGRTVHEALARFDRDRTTLADARAIAAEVAARLHAAHPDLEPLELFAIPTTRIAIALAMVEGHVTAAAHRDAERMRANGLAWVHVAGITVAHGWAPGDDRVVVEMHADTSPQEEAAEALGRTWLAELVADAPELAQIVDVIGTSH